MESWLNQKRTMGLVEKFRSHLVTFTKKSTISPHTHTHTHAHTRVCVCVFIIRISHIYIYIYIKRESEKERENTSSSTVVRKLYYSAIVNSVLTGYPIVLVLCHD